MIGDHQCGFRRNRATTDHTFCICQILEKTWEHNEAVYQLFTEFKKAYDSVRMEVLYHILIEFCIPMKLVRLIKMCLNATYSRVRIAKKISDMFPIRTGLKQGDFSQFFLRVYKFHTVLTLCECVVYGSQNKQRLLPYTSLRDWFCTTEVESVYCAVCSKFLYRMDKFSL
jgi:DNA gyrase/topoisomerase IV subunit A